MKKDNVNANVNVLERLSELLEKCLESAASIERKMDAVIGGDVR
ncbi:hypothetical protein [Heyndrickxia coagulans]|uniref:Uncharacterized protein n=1 Tax=Heyndrickxia coagulans TaxID=1398 RepID=A0A150K6L9_HEYCO|nr:hypothetical protein [Heyndrickxia coagulans]KYC65202.1 hypothetical protein B4099_0348 [Heyndrickxia coagulans]